VTSFLLPRLRAGRRPVGRWGKSGSALWHVLACGLGLAALLNGSMRGQELAPSEYQVKAVWLLNFARFAEWPTNAFPDPRAPFVVGVVGKDPFGKNLERAFEGKVFKGRPFAFKRISSRVQTQGCHILFIPSSEGRRIRDWPERLKGEAVMTVSEVEGFLDYGGTVNFVLKDNTVRFEINVKAAQSAGLKLNANLLKVAVMVKGKYD